MSSSYYVNALFPKYTAGTSVFQNTSGFSEATSCAFAANSQRSSYGAGASAFPTPMAGLYNVNSAIYHGPSMYNTGYNLNSDSYNLRCSALDQNIPVLCSDLSKQGCEKLDQTNVHPQAESNFRIYPWMRNAGMGHKCNMAMGDVQTAS